MKWRHSFINAVLLAMAAFVLSCQKDVEVVYSVPEELQPFIDKFEAEAALRGKTIDITNLIIEYGTASEQFICASCNSNSMDADVQKKIVIDNNAQCWEVDEMLEALIFHELGHCVLGRLHQNEFLPNGDPASLMIQDRLDHYACVYDLSGDNDCNNAFKREYYLDELFDPATPAPDWAQ